MPIGILRFPCPRCSAPTPLDLTKATPHTKFRCANETCTYARYLGDTFPDFQAIVAQHRHLDERAIRQRVVDTMSVWFFEWSAPDWPTE